MEATAVRKRAGVLPKSPGIYRFIERDTVLYIGKAVDLRDRVRSYAKPQSTRAAEMVGRATTIDVSVTETETQALLLEANLIKEHRPRYNVRLKDDKSYPLVQLTDHACPRIQVTRDPEENAIVFGPFTNKARLDTVVKAIREQYGIRGCSDHKFSGRTRPCLDFDIGLCSAPCTGEIDYDSYRTDVRSVERFFGGETGILMEPLQAAMNTAVAEHSFERAATIRDQIRATETFHSGKGGTVSDYSDQRLIDVLGLAVFGEEAIIARLHSENGKLIERDRHSLDIPDVDDLSDGRESVLSAFISQYYAERHLPDVILIPEDPEDDELEIWLRREGVSLRLPAPGKESTLVDLAMKNARRFSGDHDELGDLAESLDVPRPRIIEGFDISHAQGKATVGSNVVFRDGEPDKTGYRRKKLSDKNDDYENMRELIGWRALRAIEGRDERPIPDIILIDGGAGQVRAAEDALESAELRVPVIGIAKPNDVILYDQQRYSWPRDAPKLHVLQRIRDESHRFAVQYHQSVRDDIQTVLDDIPGIGPDRRTKLFRRFGSVEGIREASIAELQSIQGIGKETATIIKRYL